MKVTKLMMQTLSKFSSIKKLLLSYSQFDVDSIQFNNGVRLINYEVQFSDMQLNYSSQVMCCVSTVKTILLNTECHLLSVTLMLFQTCDHSFFLQQNTK